MKDGWKEVELGEVCQITSSKRIFKNEYVDKGIPFFRTKEVKELSEGKDVSVSLFISKDKYLSIKNSFDIPKTGDLLVSAVGTIGISYVVKNEKPFYFKDGNLVWLKNLDGIASYFLKYGITHYIRNNKQLETSGTAYKALTIEKLKKFKIPLPPLPEQQKIVAKIESLFSELDNGIANLKAAQAKLTIYRQSVLKKAFEGELTKAWRDRQTDLPDAETLLAQIKAERIRHYEMEMTAWKEAVKVWEKEGKVGGKPKKSGKAKKVGEITNKELAELSSLPNSARYFKIGELCDVVRGGSPRPAGDERFYNGNIPFLKVADLTRQEGMYVKTYTFTIKEAGLHKTRLLQKGTLVLSNSGATLGVPKITGFEATANDGIAAFLGLPDYMKPYLYHFWNSKTETLRNINQGAAQPNLNTDLIKNFIVPIFSEAEQAQIVQAIESRLNAADEVLASIEGSLEKAEALRQSILKQAFEGKLV